MQQARFCTETLPRDEMSTGLKCWFSTALDYKPNFGKSHFNSRIFKLFRNLVYVLRYTTVYTASPNGFLLEDIPNYENL